MTELSPSLHIGVLRGGPSPEYDISLKSGAYVLKQLENFHRPIDIFISKDGKWHMHGVEKSPERILKHIDVIFNALHGTYGEDGSVQELLTHYGIPFTGSTRVPSSIAMNKGMTKDRAKSLGIKTPISVIVSGSDGIAQKAQEIFNSIPHPLVVKPVSGGSSLGLYVVQTQSDLVTALQTVLSVYDSALAEEYIDGTEVTCTVINNFRGEEVYSMPPVEIRYPKHMPVWTHAVRYSDDTTLHYPHSLRINEAKQVENTARMMHSSLGLSHYSNSDFIVSPKRGVYFLEVNSQPGLTEKSILPKSLEVVGATMPEFINHALTLALRDK